jgi:hypothetical protein
MLLPSMHLEPSSSRSDVLALVDLLDSVSPQVTTNTFGVKNRVAPGEEECRVVRRLKIGDVGWEEEV